MSTTVAQNILSNLLAYFVSWELLRWKGGIQDVGQDTTKKHAREIEQEPGALVEVALTILKMENTKTDTQTETKW